MSLLESLLADIRYALRWLRKSPGFTLVAVASLAIGIGFNTALFTIVDALLFKPLPVAAPDRLVDIFTSDSTGSVRSARRRIPTISICRRRTKCSTDIAGYSPMFAALNLDNRSRLAMGEIVTGNYFQVLGVAGRARPHDPPGRRRAAAPRVAMVSHRYWMRELGSAPDAVGRTLRIRGNAVHDRRRRAARLQRHGAGAVAGAVDSGRRRRSTSNRSACTTPCRRRPGRRGSIAAAIAGCSCAARLKPGRTHRRGARQPDAADVAPRGRRIRSTNKERRIDAASRPTTSTFIRPPIAIVLPIAGRPDDASSAWCC